MSGKSRIGEVEPSFGRAHFPAMADSLEGVGVFRPCLSSTTPSSVTFFSKGKAGGSPGAFTATIGETGMNALTGLSISLTPDSGKDVSKITGNLKQHLLSVCQPI